MTYRQRIIFLICIDSWNVIIAILLSALLVSESYNVFSLTTLISMAVLLISHHFLSFKYKLYKKAWEYASIGELLSTLKVVTISIFITSLAQSIVENKIYFRFLMTSWLLTLFFICGSRLCWRIFRDSFLSKEINKKRTLIVGAGSAGMMVARQLKSNKTTDLLPVGFIDDDDKKQRLDILGIPVVGGVAKIKEAVTKYNIDNIVIAIPSLKKKELNMIFLECAKTSAKTKILPMLEDLVSGKVSVNQFRDVRVEDLLGREPNQLDINSISKSIQNKVVLVTGAGGSIGSEICRQISKFHPKQLILLGHGENSIYLIEMELKEIFKHTNITFIPIIADIQDEQKMMSVITTYQPDVIYHAAAHKHVPLMENNPEEAVKNNLIGTMNVAKAASWNGVKTFVMVSTDKAVNPTSVMGATKRLAEMVIQHMDKESSTKFVAVRFGNVLGSRGSVIPLFKNQIKKGGPVTVTHPDMVRYFMTIPEASRLVIQAGSIANGGEIFVLDMGSPVKIVDLAKNLITLSGNSIEEIGIEFTGIRPGEKLFEELLNIDEVQEQRVHPNIYIGKTSELYMKEIDELLSIFSNLTKEEIKQRLLFITNRKKMDSEMTVIT
ncbi:polysaccharide biosynthesis protein [Bacillus sp. BRMEA1]|uniref:polysaccharide biosynthesis protein n=1 Tax=Neobacillus endophyticus TaxID=2738405 RepID=UPI001563E3CA|nr:nucleoside-diphosphate sugar epimerase/dehydratase [Neobacillus endophyticus]NRD76344.1 polysaccharide biosynthesis protein [Neobacillus endophyticus]